ncbi:transporter [Geothermobacter hydrogeniphilus]|uniref:MetA-pathway of phenol degradation n=1 Tax=Geothermobacter hydrogeniphilus TaxID=1969733 RepID=A0A1X0XQ82_9BACT|nr:transporter [Geothermobacter hydrogeniphilus]ORJ55052.1 hypothetical protein B5V00_15380 [Geothermobacter hydrogeniphilus]
MNILSRPLLICFFCLTLPLTASAATLQPLGIKDAATLASGTGELRFGIAYLSDSYLLFQRQGSDRTQVSVPELDLTLGLGKRIEVEAIYELLLLDETGRDSDIGSGDLRLATKINLIQEDLQLPAISLRVATKLPNASRTDGFGTDEADNFIDLLVSRTFPTFSLHTNLGLAILGDPNDRQDDKLHYAFAVSYPLPAHNLNLLAGIEGYDFGPDNLNDRGTLTAGAQIRLGGSTIDLGASVGYRSRSEDWGLRAGLTTPFDLPEGW